MPKSEKSKPDQYSEKIDPGESGRWRSGIAGADMCALFGALISEWVHVEESMIDFIDLLLYPNADLRLKVDKAARGFAAGRQVFRPIGSNGGRVKVMSALLAFYPGNDLKRLNPRFREVITEFQSLTNLRNDYLHGLWWTKFDGNVYLQTENVEESMFNKKRRIPKKDFERFNSRCTSLQRMIEALELIEYRASDERKADLARLVGRPLKA